MAANPYTTNLELQLDARDISGLSDGDPITTWTDSSAAGNDVTQATASYRPVYKTNIIGSNPAVTFTDNAEKSLYASFASSWSGYNGITVFALVKFAGYGYADYARLLGLSSTAGTDNNILAFRCEAADSGDRVWGRSVFGIWANNQQIEGPVGCLSRGIPVLMGFSIKQGSYGLKVFGPLGIGTEVAVARVLDTPQELVIANGYISGAVSTTRGARVSITMMLLYKEYMSDSNISDVVNWLLTEFDLHTQAAGGGGSILRVPGMGGGFNT